MDWAFRLLARRARSRAEMEAALAARGYARTRVRRTLARLSELGYLDDVRYAAERAELLGLRGYGSERIRTDLERAGVAARLVSATVDAIPDERERARHVLESRFGTVPDDPGERLRAARHLAARGFPETVVRDVLGFAFDE